MSVQCKNVFSLSLAELYMLYQLPKYNIIDFFIVGAKCSWNNIFY